MQTLNYYRPFSLVLTGFAGTDSLAAAAVVPQTPSPGCLPAHTDLPSPVPSSPSTADV